jgi:hypothetical protein
MFRKNRQLGSHFRVLLFLDFFLNMRPKFQLAGIAALGLRHSCKDTARRAGPIQEPTFLRGGGRPGGGGGGGKNNNNFDKTHFLLMLR